MAILLRRGPDPMRRTRVAASVALALFALAPGGVSAAPEARLWPRWQAHDPASGRTIDHAAWQRFLDGNVRLGGDAIARIAYRRVGKADRARLAGYIGRLSGLAIGRYSRDAQFAFWVNLYNALTVQLILDRAPRNSIRELNISPGLFATGPWGRKLVRVEAVALSLDDIEHRILRPLWRDPRIHYAVNCAAVGCPNLLRTAYTGKNADRLLDRAARAYVNNWRGAQFVAGELYVSSLYKWYRADFGGTVAGVLDHLGKYAVPKLAARLRGVRDIRGYQYDWSLNRALEDRQ